MVNSENKRKDVKRNNPTRKQKAESEEKSINAKKMKTMCKRDYAVSVTVIMSLMSVF